MAPALTPGRPPAFGALARAIERVWGAPPLFTREGGSGPEEALGRVLGAPVLFLGVGLPDDRIHAPNERMVMASSGGACSRRASCGPRWPPPTLAPGAPRPPPSHDPVPRDPVPDPSPTQPADVHEWVSFQDPDEQRTWVFDVTFLPSPWTCIFGDGCQGVLTGPAPELVQGCCSYGAHFTDDADGKRVEAAAKRLTDDSGSSAARPRSAAGPSR